MSLNDASTGLQADITAKVGDIYIHGGRWFYPATAAALKVFLIGPISLPASPYKLYPWLDRNGPLYVYVYLTRTGASDVAQLDWYEFLAGNLVYVDGSSGPSSLIIDGKSVIGTSATPYLDSFLKFRGDQALDLVPNKYNSLVSYTGIKDAAPELTRTLTYTTVIITPRFVFA